MCRRFNIPGHAHELTFSCFQRLPLLERDRTRGWLIEAIGEARKRERFDLWAFVIMPEHAHLLVHPRAPDY
jgi:putative transposase